MDISNIKMKKKQNLVNRLKKEFVKGFLRFYYFFEVKYLSFFLFQNKEKKYFKTNMISLLCPTKNRSKKFARFVESLLDNTNQYNRIELLVGFDLVEDEIDLYEQTISKLNRKGITVKKSSYKETDKIFKQIMMLPMNTALKDYEIKYIIEKIKKFYPDE